MNLSFDALIGSWEFTKRDHPSINTPLTSEIYHFLKNGTYIWELSEFATNSDKRKLAKPKEFIVKEDKLILTLGTTSTNNLQYHETDDDQFCFSSTDGVRWWMRRLFHPKPFMLGFVDETGEFGFIKKTEPGAAANP